MSTVKANTYQDFSGGSNAIFSGVASPPNSMGFRNRLINGDMRIDQRNAGASSTPSGSSSGTYTLDRWCYQASQTGKFNVQRNAGSVTPPTGFTNYLGFTVASAVTIVAGDYFNFYQAVEGLNTADLAWGTAGAQAVTLSFWVYSSLTGTFSGSVKNGSVNRSYPFSYTISSANTWEQKFVTISGDTSGTWNTDNNVGLYLIFSLGNGSTFSGTAGVWTGSNLNAVTGTVNVVATNAATFYITGVQLEAGTNASPFERRDYGRELMMCQRYYYRLNPSSATNDVAAGYNSNANSARYVFSFPVTLRAEPSALETSGTNSDYAVLHGITSTNCDSQPTFANATRFAARINASVAAGSLTAGQGSLFRINTATAYLGWSAEL